MNLNGFTPKSMRGGNTPLRDQNKVGIEKSSLKGLFKSRRWHDAAPENSDAKVTQVPLLELTSIFLQLDGESGFWEQRRVSSSAFYTHSINYFSFYFLYNFTTAARKLRLWKSCFYTMCDVSMFWVSLCEESLGSVREALNVSICGKRCYTCCIDVCGLVFILHLHVCVL